MSDAHVLGYSLVPKVLGKNLHTRRSWWICLDCCFLTAQCVGAESSWRKAEQHSWPRMMRWWCLESIPLIIASQNDQSMLDTGRKSENIRTCWKINSLLLWWHYWKHHLHPPAPFENHPRNNGKPTKKTEGGTWCLWSIEMRYIAKDRHRGVTEWHLEKFSDDGNSCWRLTEYESENKILRFFAAVMWENSLRQFEKIKNFTSFISGWI